MEQKRLASAIIAQLQAVRQRPTLWAQNLSEARGLIHGVHMACQAIGLEAGYDAVYQEVAIDHGWEWLPAAGALPSMHSRGMSDEEIIRELLDIEIEAWRRRYELPPIG